MRASSVAMCYTSGLGHVGLSVACHFCVSLFSLIPMSGMVPDVLGSNLYMRSGRVLTSLRFQPTCWLACQTLSAETKSSVFSVSVSM